MLAGLIDYFGIYAEALFGFEFAAVDFEEWVYDGFEAARGLFRRGLETKMRIIH